MQVEADAWREGLRNLQANGPRQAEGKRGSVALTIRVKCPAEREIPAVGAEPLARGGVDSREGGNPDSAEEESSCCLRWE